MASLLRYNTPRITARLIRSRPTILQDRQVIEEHEVKQMRGVAVNALNSAFHICYLGASRDFTELMPRAERGTGKTCATSSSPRRASQ